MSPVVVKEEAGCDNVTVTGVNVVTPLRSQPNFGTA